MAEEAQVVGSEAEAYLRVLQVAGVAPAGTWSLRPLAARQASALLPDSGHPWAPRAGASRPGGLVRGGLLRPAVRLTYNSALPYGFNDGATWAGAGATAEASAGISARLGPLSLRVQPAAFWSENRPFRLMANADTGRLVYADGRFPRGIDLPQRFGAGHYARLDPGESTLRLDVLKLAAGVSTASQHWGPAADHPIVLGNNAGGFPHAFAGTGAPVNLGVGRLHGRVLWGWLDQSPYSSMSGHGSRRYGTGLAAVFTPRGADGLELGVTRFFHAAWPREGLKPGDLLKVFEGVTKVSLDSTGQGPDGRSATDNQLASVFFRWLLPSGGVEAYGEFGREDHNWDLLDAALEPDHASAYLLGFRKVWVRGDAGLVSLRAEVLNSQPSHLLTVRNQAPFYRHAFLRQGHTLRGQALGSAFGYGGGASVVAVDVYRRWGRWSAGWSRGRMGDQAEYSRTGQDGPRAVDVVHALSAEAVAFARGFEVTFGVAGAAELNRHFERDAFNLNGHLGLRLGH